MAGRPDDLTALLTPSRQAPLSATQGFLTAWNAVTHANTVEVDGGELFNLPVVFTADLAALSAGTLVLLLRVRNTYYVLGKITYP